MSNNFNDNNDDNTYIFKSTDSQNNTDSNIVKYESSSFKFNITTSPSLIINNILFFNNFVIKFFKELLQELYIILLNTEISNIETKLNNFVNDFLFEYDLNPKNVFEIMTSSPQNISCYSSLIGFFYQQGIGCEVDQIKAFEMFSNFVKNNQKVGSNQFSFNQENEAITFCNGDMKKLNEIILQYFYSLFLFKDVILYRKDNYKLHIRNAEKGDPVSQYYIGNCYYNGKNIKKDYNMAIEWYLKSLEGGNIKAMHMLGDCYYYGCDITKDKKKAFELYLKSAEGGYNTASLMVGNCYSHGIGVLRDENKAFEWNLKAAKKGNSYRQYLVATYYNDRIYIPENKEKGFYWNRKAAINGDINAQFRLAKYYLNDSINKNEIKAFRWYLKLADKKLSKANYLVAKCYRDGIGTDKNLDEAKEWFKKFESSYTSLFTLRYFKNITLTDFLNGSNITHLEH